ncbi:RNA-binding protein lark-like isoform X2 [Homarus americanus]|uniref:RNA-binding protein lark-like 4 n=1 Tax=Homarus americanus TaxID=6706 RepID=A0A8J5T7V2_HOMAM|nr:RNA-binding protein lark-like isoform X2 [Homarus americanus]KAG7173025.1 RNA-binding protein lark-like 4 [Homarus americanus]
MESDETLKEELDRVHQEIDQMSNEENQAAQNGVVLDEKERLQIRLAELEILYKNAQQELEATREALAKLQTNECMSTATGTETENNHPLESAASETSVKSQNTKVDFDIKQVSTQTPEWENTYKIFVGNLSNRASGSDIRKLFEAHGTVVEADVVRNYGFVHMENEEEGRVAIEALNGCSLHGKPMVVKASTGARKDDNQTTNILIGNLPKDSKLEELKSLFGVNSNIVESDTLTNCAFVISTKKPVQRKTFKIFLGNLSHRATTAEIRQLFEAHGTVVEVDVLKSFGFVHMAKEEEGKAAIIALNGYILDERPMVVKASTGAKKGGNQRTKIYVGNLHKNTKLLELKRLFEMYGNVVEADIITNYAFVHMDDEAQAQRAIRELDGHEFHGLRLKVRKSTSHARQEAGIRNPDMYFPSGSSGNWFRQYPSDERIEASRYPDCERGGQSFGRKNDLYPPLLPPSYAREHMMHYRDDFDQYYDEGLYERHYGDHPTPPPPVLDNLYNRRLPPLPPHPDFLRYGRGLPPPRNPHPRPPMHGNGPPNHRLF